MPLYRPDQDIQASEQALSTFPDNPIYISSYREDPIALRAHADTALSFAQAGDSTLSSYNHQFLSPLLPVVEPPSAIPANAQTSSRTTRPSNAFMIFRSEFVKQHKHAGRRQQELSVMAACAWRTLGTDGQTEWYEKAALAKGKHDIKNPELNAPRQRPKPYRPRVNARDVAHTDTMHPVRETYATLSPSLSARRRMRKSVEQPIVPPSTLSIQDPIPIARSSTFTSSSTLAHALHPPSFFAGHHYHRSEEVNASPTSSIESDKYYGGSNVQQWTRATEIGRFDYVASDPISTAASATPSSPCDSFSPQDVSSFPSPTQYPSPVSPGDWSHRFVEPHYNPLPTASYGHVGGFYDEHGSRQDHFHNHDHYF